MISGFTIQIHDGQQGDGTGDCGFTIKDEIVPPLKYDKPGMLGLARLTQRNSGACQFFITDAAYASLNGGTPSLARWSKDRTWSARHVSPKDSNDKPRTPVKLIEATISLPARRPPRRLKPPREITTPAKTDTAAPAPKKAATPAAMVEEC